MCPSRMSETHPTMSATATGYHHLDAHHQPYSTLSPQPLEQMPTEYPFPMSYQLQSNESQSTLTANSTLRLRSSPRPSTAPMSSQLLSSGPLSLSPGSFARLDLSRSTTPSHYTTPASSSLPSTAVRSKMYGSSFGQDSFPPPTKSPEMTGYIPHNEDRRTSTLSGLISGNGSLDPWAQTWIYAPVRSPRRPVSGSSGGDTNPSMVVPRQFHMMGLDSSRNKSTSTAEATLAKDTLGLDVASMKDTISNLSPYPAYDGYPLFPDNLSSYRSYSAPVIRPAAVQLPSASNARSTYSPFLSTPGPSDLYTVHPLQHPRQPFPAEGSSSRATHPHPYTYAQDTSTPQRPTRSLRSVRSQQYLHQPTPRQHPELSPESSSRRRCASTSSGLPLDPGPSVLNPLMGRIVTSVPSATAPPLAPFSPSLPFSPSSWQSNVPGPHQQDTRRYSQPIPLDLVLPQEDSSSLSNPQQGQWQSLTKEGTEEREYLARGDKQERPPNHLIERERAAVDWQSLRIPGSREVAIAMLMRKTTKDMGPDKVPHRPMNGECRIRH